MVLPVNVFHFVTILTSENFQEIIKENGSDMILFIQTPHSDLIGYIKT